MAPPGEEPVWRLSISKKADQFGDSRASARVEYAKLPDDLRSKMGQSFWRGLELRQRQTLVETYRRLSEYGLWDQVTRVTGIADEPEPPVTIAGVTFWVPGNSGGIAYESRDAKAFEESLVRTGHFGLDGRVVGYLHKGMDSMREWSSASDSLHVSISRKDNSFDAHVDKYSPTSQPDDGHTKIDPAGGARHHPREVWPEKIRDVLGIPGVVVGGDVVPGSRDGGPEIQIKVGIEGHWGGEHHEPLQPKDQPTPTEEVPADVIARIDDAVAHIPVQGGLVPPGTPADQVDNFPDRQTVAHDIAHRVQHAAHTGESRIRIELGDGFVPHSPHDRQLAADEVRRIGQAVVRTMGPTADGISAVTITVHGHVHGTEPLR